jgi:hypothetical protein
MGSGKVPIECRTDSNIFSPPHNLEIPVVFLGAFEYDFLNIKEVLKILKDKFPGV